MKAWEFNFWRERWMLLRFSVVQSYHNETAYFFNNWLSLAATLSYTLTYIVFLKVIFSNVQHVAGYSENEMFFLLLISQLNFYGNSLWSADNCRALIDDVNRGDFDLILIKPLPALFYTTFREVNLLSFARDAIPPILAVAFFIDWTDLHLQLQNILLGIIIFVAGQAAFHVFQFLLALLVFWRGEATNVFQISWSFFGREIPYEGLNQPLRILFNIIIPVYLASSTCASAILGKSSASYVVVGAVLVAAVALLIKSLAWQAALRNYTSASS